MYDIFNQSIQVKIILHLVSVKTSQDSDSMIQGYIHQHVWLLFTVLAMATGDIIHPEQSQGFMDQDYVKLAEQLQAQCMEIATHCLKQVPDDAEGKSFFYCISSFWNIFIQGH